MADSRTESTSKVRVVVLSKAHRLTSYLVQELSKNGLLAGVVHEHRFDSFASRLRYLRRNVKREGFWHTIDAVAFDVVDRLTRGADFRQHADRLVPLDDQRMARLDADVIHVKDLNSAAAREAIAALQPDILVVHATGILKEPTIALARVAAINIHCGVLPEYRGHASTFWAMSRGDADNIGVSVHLVARTVDTGAPLAVERVRMDAADDDLTMWIKAFRRGVEAVVSVCSDYDPDKALPTGRYDGTFGPHYVRRGLTQHLRFVWLALPKLRRSAGTRGP